MGTAKLIGYSVERAVYGPPMPPDDDVPTGSPIHQFGSGWVTRSKHEAAEVARRLAVKYGGRFILVRYTETGCKAVTSWTQPLRRPSDGDAPATRPISRSDQITTAFARALLEQQP